MVWETVIGIFTILTGIVWTTALWNTEDQDHGMLSKVHKTLKVRSHIP